MIHGAVRLSPPSGASDHAGLWIGRSKGEGYTVRLSISICAGSPVGHGHISPK